MQQGAEPGRYSVKHRDANGENLKGHGIDGDQCNAIDETIMSALFVAFVSVESHGQYRAPGKVRLKIVSRIENVRGATRRVRNGTASP